MSSEYQDVNSKPGSQDSPKHTDQQLRSLRVFKNNTNSGYLQLLKDALSALPSHNTESSPIVPAC
jgi:hypothetical protein